MNRSGNRDEQKEEVISKLWNSASKDLRKINEHKLADKCSLKGYYWASPEEWDNNESNDAEIEVNQVLTMSKIYSKNTHNKLSQRTSKPSLCSGFATAALKR